MIEFDATACGFTCTTSVEMFPAMEGTVTFCECCMQMVGGQGAAMVTKQTDVDGRTCVSVARGHWKCIKERVQQSADLVRRASKESHG